MSKRFGIALSGMQRSYATRYRRHRDHVERSVDYPEDSFDNMARIARECDFSFPYVWDETQQVAKAYGAVCTPDFFGLNDRLELQYRGRLDASRKEAAPPGARRELFEGMLQVARTGQGPTRTDSQHRVFDQVADGITGAQRGHCCD